MIVTIESLLRKVEELHKALERSATMAHYARKDAGSFTHRGPFANCPDPDCVAVRVLLGKEEVNNE